MTEPPTLETERLILRGWRESDLDGFAALYETPESRFIAGPQSRDGTWRIMALQIGHWALRGYGSFVLESKQTRSFLGYCGPWNPLGFPEQEIGWGLLPSARGQGYATEAAKRALQFAFETLQWPTAISLIATENSASRRVVERLGAVLESSTEYRGLACGIWRHPTPSRSTANRTAPS